MGTEQAAADLAALTAAITRAEAAASRVRTVFAQTEGSLRGAAATAATSKAGTVAADITRAAAIARSASSGLKGVANTLAATKAKSPALRAAAAELAKDDLTSDQVAQVRAAVAGVMDEVYSDPMLATSTPIGDEPGEPQELAAVGPPNHADPGSENQRDSDLGSSLGGLSSSGGPGAPSGGPAAGQPVAAGTTVPSAATNQPGSAAQSGGGKPSDGNRSGPSPGANTPSGLQRTGNQPNPSPGGPGGPAPGLGGVGRLGGTGGPRIGAGPGLPRLGMSTPRLLGFAPPPPVPGGPVASPMGAGMRGGVPPYVPRSATRSEESSDRPVAAYLHAQVNTEEVVGELPLVGPAVIGEPEPPPDSPDDASGR